MLVWSNPVVVVSKANRGGSILGDLPQGFQVLMCVFRSSNIPGDHYGVRGVATDGFGEVLKDRSTGLRVPSRNVEVEVSRNEDLHELFR